MPQEHKINVGISGAVEMTLEEMQQEYQRMKALAQAERVFAPSLMYPVLLILYRHRSESVMMTQTKIWLHRRESDPSAMARVPDASGLVISREVSMTMRRWPATDPNQPCCISCESPQMNKPQPFDFFLCNSSARYPKTLTASHQQLVHSKSSS